jgi:uncharacterized short protein YbdD (DUF466 family)
MHWRDVSRSIARAAHLMVGIPDYETYVAHRRSAHPGEPLMSRAEFHRNRMESRYGGSGISKCC